MCDVSSCHRFAFPGFAVALALTVAGTAPAAAQNFFEQLFGGRPQQRERYAPPQSSFFSDPFGTPEERPQAPAMSTGRYVAYCVRLCDGRYFPMQRHANVSAPQLCSQFCPAAKTQVFSGSQIEYAIAPNGQRYGDIDNAFVYRKQIVANCTCNGRDAFGLAPVDITADPTMKTGDIVVTAEGPMSFNGRAWTRAAVNLKPAPAPVRAKPATPEEEMPED